MLESLIEYNFTATIETEPDS